MAQRTCGRNQLAEAHAVKKEDTSKQGLLLEASIISR
jgi:hypothetical protein